MESGLQSGRRNAVDDPGRLRTVQRVMRHDARLRGAFDRVTDVVAVALEAPVALVSLVTDDRQRFTGCVGLPDDVSAGTPLSHSFCRHVVERSGPLIIRDAREHELVYDNPAIADLGVIAYAGMPLRFDEHVIGSLCAIDTVPRDWTPLQLATLERLAQLVEVVIAARLGSVTDLHEARMGAVERESVSRQLQQALLAQPADPGAFDVQTIYEPGSRRLLLGGDFTAIRTTPDGALDFVIGDVSGHGPEAAALAVSLRASWRALRSTGVHEIGVLGALDEIVAESRLLATMLLGTLRPGGHLRLLNAGHPAPLAVAPGRVRELSRPPEPLLGLALPTRPWTAHTHEIGDDTLLAFTDGLIEGRGGADGDRYGVEGLIACIQRRGADLAGLVADATEANGDQLEDDVAILRLRAPAP